MCLLKYRDWEHSRQHTDLMLAENTDNNIALLRPRKNELSCKNILLYWEHIKCSYKDY